MPSTLARAPIPFSAFLILASGVESCSHVAPQGCEENSEDIIYRMKQRQPWSRWLAAGAAFGLSAVLFACWMLTETGDAGADAGWLSEEAVPVVLANIERELASAELPLQMNERVELWARRFITEQKPVFEELLSREGLYSEMITAKLRERDMPEELIYLAMIESGFVPSARSSVSALGVWQFMGPTALAYGLRIDSYVDERRDPVRATDAALDYLGELFQRYGSWYLAAAAYNAGPTRVSEILNRHAGGRVGDESLYWEIIDVLPSETANFVPKLLAATYVARYASKYGFEVTRAEPYLYDIVWTPGETPPRRRRDGRRRVTRAYSRAEPTPGPRPDASGPGIPPPSAHRYGLGCRGGSGYAALRRPARG